MTNDLVIMTLATGILSALATGLGAFPVALANTHTPSLRGLGTAFAAGMMLAASVLCLIPEGWETNSIATAAGMLLGALGVWLAERFLDRPTEASPQSRQGRRGLLLFLVMFLHSIPEGTAIGVGFATGDFKFGLTTALAISIHNIPEGIAISLSMFAAGASLWRCFWLSVLSSLPQPIVALPALYLTSHFQALLPWGLGFAAGAMVFVAVWELLPDALTDCGRIRTSTGTAFGFGAMALSTWLLNTSL